MALVNINEGFKEEYPMNKTFSAKYDFSCVRQIARADRFAKRPAFSFCTKTTAGGFAK